MGKLGIKKIEEIADVITGGTPSTLISEYWENGTVPWLQSGVCQNNDITECSTYITEAGLHNSSAQVMPKDSVLIALTGATTGKVGYLTFNACANQSVTGIIPNDNFIPRYLFYYLISIRKKILADSYGGAQKHISQGYVKKIPVPLPPLDEQKRIADVLDKASELIKKRKEQIRLMDELAKSLFIEMFGDPVENPMGWDEEILSNLGEIVSGITKGRKTSENNLKEVPYMRVANVKDGHLDLSEIKFIEATPNEIERYKLEPGDVLLTEGGDNDKLGRGALWHGEITSCIHQNHIFRVRVKPGLILSLYLAEYLKFSKSKRYFLRVAKQTTGIASINMKQLSALPVLLPPLELQNEFADRINAIEQQKALLQDGLAKMETAYKALMQEYFG